MLTILKYFFALLLFLFTLLSEKQSIAGLHVTS